jgi:hypothetical protein
MENSNEMATCRIDDAAEPAVRHGVYSAREKGDLEKYIGVDAIFPGLLVQSDLNDAFVEASPVALPGGIDVVC